MPHANTTFFPLFPLRTYKQNRGRTKSRGNKNGTATSDIPHVQDDATTAVHSMASTDADTMKQPPRTRGWTVTIVVVVVAVLVVVVFLWLELRH